MSQYVSQFFAVVFSLLGVSSLPSSIQSKWNVVEAWHKSAYGYEAILSSTEIVEECKKNPEKYILFPRVIHSFHQVSLDGKELLTHGDKTFEKGTSFYEMPFIQCKLLGSGDKLTWTISSYSSFFARFLSWPELIDNPQVMNFYSVTLNIFAVSSLLILALFSAIVFSGRISQPMVISISLSSVLFSIYFFGSVSNYFGLTTSMLVTHKIADAGLWGGAYLIAVSYYYDGFLSKSIAKILTAFVCLGVLIILFGTNGDVVQLGTITPLAFWSFSFLCIFANLYKKGRETTFSNYYLAKLFAVGFFVLAGLNDIITIFGLTNTNMLLPLGLPFGVFAIVLSVNQNIEATYKERDNLLANLENKVIEKTKHLEEALTSLKSTQAELVQSAKLASLGTVSAGIAHEINNSINYVSGAIVPLEKKVYALIPKTADRKMIEKLFAAIKEGTSLTVDIVKSLRNFTGLNQAEFKEVRIGESLRSIQTILKSKLRNVDFKCDISNDCVMHGNLAAINQIFMNLITNSLDALDKDQKTIYIKGVRNENNISISIKDNGKGIKAEICDKIFDPFFTTKDVGNGTGLGLHIVSKEIERHGGQIKVFSELNVGTEFVIILPALAESNQIREAA